MNKEFFEALDIIEKERGIKKEVLLEKIVKAMEVAVEKDLGIEGNVNVTVDHEKKNFSVAVMKTVVEDVQDDYLEVGIDEIDNPNGQYKVGDEYSKTYIYYDSKLYHYRIENEFDD